jgi:hypothetical protein
MRNRLFSAVIAAAAVALACAFWFSAAAAHDMGAMDGMDHATAPNAMGAHMHLDEHMRMTDTRPASPDDIARARNLLDAMRHSLKRYHNYRVALAQGMRIFLPSIPQDVYHFVDYPETGEEYQGRFDPARPGSLLYTRDAGGEYTLVGAMYSAAPDATPEQLDAMVPLSVARWHAHTNICLPEGISINDLLRGEVGAGREGIPGTLPVADVPNAAELNHRLGFLADGRFGFEGKIADSGQCVAAGGHFIPQAFGWMVHVYPFAGDDLKVAFGTSVPKVSSMSPSASR